MLKGTSPPFVSKTTADGRNPANELRLVVYPIIYSFFLHPRWLFGISAINGITGFVSLGCDHLDLIGWPWLSHDGSMGLVDLPTFTIQNQCKGQYTVLPYIDPMGPEMLLYMFYFRSGNALFSFQWPKKATRKPYKPQKIYSLKTHVHGLAIVLSISLKNACWWMKLVYYPDAPCMAYVPTFGSNLR